MLDRGALEAVWESLSFEGPSQAYPLSVFFPSRIRRAFDDLVVVVGQSLLVTPLVRGLR